MGQKRRCFNPVFIFLLTLLIGAPEMVGSPAALSKQEQLDKRVRTFLEKIRNRWWDMNVPESDGKLLYDIVLKNGYKRALEIGTSTGRSGIWIAWALSKTGGKLITIDIDRQRHEQALANFKEAGLMEYIDARLADAHELVPRLQGPFDFVFSDADKEWYTNYFLALDPKLKVGGCFTAHNISRYRQRGGTQRFYRYIKKLSNYSTTLDSSGNGLSISYKRAKK